VKAYFLAAKFLTDEDEGKSHSKAEILQWWFYSRLWEGGPIGLPVLSPAVYRYVYMRIYAAVIQRVAKPEIQARLLHILITAAPEGRIWGSADPLKFGAEIRNCVWRL